MQVAGAAEAEPRSRSDGVEEDDGSEEEVERGAGEEREGGEGAHSVKPILVQPSEEENAELDNPIRVKPKVGMQRKATPAPQLSEEESAEFYKPIRVQPNVGMQRKATPAAQLPPISSSGARQARVAGIGIDFVIDSAGRLVIESLTPGGPAERNRTLAQGDVLISIDAVELVGQWLSFDRVLDMLRDEEGSDVILGFERPGKP